MPYIRKSLFNSLWESLQGEPRLIQVVTGPRQVGKTTMALQLFRRWRGHKIYETADHPDTPDGKWIQSHWEAARKHKKKNNTETLLVLDEVQKVPRWSQKVKKLIDEDKRRKTKLRVVLLGSSALLVQRGLIESLAGRFELHRHPHWSFNECKRYFHASLDDYLIFGGYPGGLPLRSNYQRWARYIRDSLIETVISKDVLLMSPVQKPALLRQVFGMACGHPAELLTYEKMLGQLTDAGNTVTIAHYFDLLASAFLLKPLQKWSGSRVRQRGSVPKIIVRDNSLTTAMTLTGNQHKKIDPSLKGRLVENAVGAALVTLAEQEGGDVFYWRDRKDEVDFVFKLGQFVIGIEVKSGKDQEFTKGCYVFKRRYPKSELILISPQSIKKKRAGYISLEMFLRDPHIILPLHT